MEERTAANEEMRTKKPSPAAEPANWVHAIERIGRVARERKGERFTTLLSHMRAPLLREAYSRLRPDAAPGVDGMTWKAYGEDLDARLQDLEGRLHRGSYHPQPVRRVHIPKADGRTRPLGIPTVEDKIVQQAARMLMEPIYEISEFVGFSYGFRPNRNQHDALDALATAIIKHKVNWIIDADIQAYFDTIEHARMQSFIEERIADRRFVRLLMKMVHAGVMEDGTVHEVEEGTPQGGIISPLLANIYLHYALDCWVREWRRTEARGEMYFIRYADDFVVALQYENEARELHALMAKQLSAHGLTLHPEKTRIIEFGRFAARNREAQRARPETFTFLGFTHICGKTRDGRFRLMRRTSRKKRMAKLRALRDEIRARRHEPVGDQHRWLSSVCDGHYRYYGVPGNQRAMSSFRFAIRRMWLRALASRSQRARWNKEKLARHDARFNLPWERVTHPNPLDRFTARRLGGGSPVREIRTPGSVRGAAPRR